MSKKANYNYKTDYMKITPFGVTYMKKGEKVHKPFDVNYYDLRRQLKEIRYDDFYESIGGKNAYSEKVERMEMPSICKLFYRMFCDSLRIPTPKGLVNEYVSRYCDKIDDKEYSKRYIDSVKKRQGQRLTEYKLMMKGVKKEDIESAYFESEVDGNESAKLVAEKYLKNKENTKENLAKTYRYLIGKGFSYEQATYAISQFREE